MVRQNKLLKGTLLVAVIIILYILIGFVGSSSTKSKNNSFGAAIIGFFLGLFLFISGLFSYKKKQLIENIPTSKIRSLSMGLVEIYGEVVPIKEQVLKAPFSKNDCVYWKYTIEERRKSGKSSKWVTVKSGEQFSHFFLKDESGAVLVDPQSAQIEIPFDFEFTSNIGKDPPKNILGFLSANNLSFETFFGINKAMRFREYFIAPQNKLYILGFASDNPFVQEATAVEGVNDIMIQKGNEKYYLISDTHENDILKDLRFTTYTRIFGGAILSIVCLSIVIVYLKLL